MMNLRYRPVSETPPVSGAAGRRVLPHPGHRDPAPVRGAARLPARGRDRSGGGQPVRLHRASGLRGARLPGRRSGVLPDRKPGPKSAPAKDAARARIIELRAAGHSIDEIADALATEGLELNRTGVAEVIAEQGLPRLWRRPDAERGGPRRDVQPRAEVLDFTRLPARPRPRWPGCC